MRWLHRLLDNCQQLFVQLAQVYLVAQHGGEGGKRAGRVVLAVVEAGFYHRKYGNQATITPSLICITRSAAL